MSKIVRVIHTGGGSLTYRFQGKPITLIEGKRASMSEDLYNQHRDKLILESDEAFLKISPDYKGTPEPFNQPRPVNPIVSNRPLSKLAQRAVELVEQDQVQIDDGLNALRESLAEREAEWVGRSTPEEYIKRYGKDNKKSKLAAEIIRLKGLIAEAEVG